MDESNFNIGDLVYYSKSVTEGEIGVVKSVHENGCRVAYHLGDATALTPFYMLRIVSNGYAIGGLAERVKQLTGKLFLLSENCEDWSKQDELK